MAFTYETDDPSAALDRLRLAIGDTLEDAGPRVGGRNFSDGELNAFLTEAGGVWGIAAPRVLRTLASEYASAAGSLRYEQYSEDFTTRAKELRSQAAEMERTYQSDLTVAGGMVSGEITLDYFSSPDDTDET